MFRIMFTSIRQFIARLAQQSPEQSSDYRKEPLKQEIGDSAQSQTLPQTEIDDATAAEVVSTWSLLNPP